MKKNICLLLCLFMIHYKNYSNGYTSRNIVRHHNDNLALGTNTSDPFKSAYFVQYPFVKGYYFYNNLHQFQTIVAFTLFVNNGSYDRTVIIT